jgi:hypothetical protein
VIKSINICSRRQLCNMGKKEIDFLAVKIDFLAEKIDF